MNFFILTFCLKLCLINCDYNINDDVLFGISWKNEEEIINDNSKSITLLSKDKESFRCVLPTMAKNKFDNSYDRNYNGPSESDLLKALSLNKLCSVKIEGYWSYEICHGRYVRQFHEDSVQGKRMGLQEYSLGIYKSADLQLSQNEAVPDIENKKLPTVTINSVNFPYYQVNMTDGTKCELIGQSRSINILYICQTDGRGEIYEIHEVRTCHYQAIVFTKLLCAHPGYKVTDNHVNEISCFHVDGLESLPKRLSMLQDEIETEMNSISTLDGMFNENLNIGSQIKVEAYKENGVIIYRIKTLGKSLEQKPGENIGSTSEKSESPVMESSIEKPPALDPENPLLNPKKVDLNPETSKHLDHFLSERSALLHRFMSGKFCVDGGEGWWRHRVCYNRKISQYHMEMTYETTEIILGLWKEDAHKEWLQRNLDKRPSMPAEDRLEIYYYFSDGHFCDEIKAKRDTILRIRCVKDNSSAILISFLEPRTCSYIVTIESSLFCSMIREADEFGLVKPKEE